MMIDKVKETFSVVSIQNLQSKRMQPQGGEKASCDAVNVSDFAREMAEIAAELKKTPDIRETMVAEINQKIAEGSYDLKTSQVACLLINAGILKNEE